MAKGMKTGGRQAGTPNKSTADMREAAQQYTADALQTLVDVMQDAGQPAAARISAATAILDRAYGKPQIYTETTLSTNANAPTVIELVAFTGD